MVTDHQVFHTNEHGVTEVEFTRHVGGGDGDNIGPEIRIMIRLVGVVDRLEVAERFPHLVDAVFGVLEIVGFREFWVSHEIS
jgi:hypothetical protein